MDQILKGEWQRCWLFGQISKRPAQLCSYVYIYVFAHAYVQIGLEGIASGISAYG